MSRNKMSTKEKNMKHKTKEEDKKPKNTNKSQEEYNFAEIPFGSINRLIMSIVYLTFFFIGLCVPSCLNVQVHMNMKSSSSFIKSVPDSPLVLWQLLWDLPKLLP